MRPRDWLIVVLLAGLTLASYAHVTGFDFVNWDDQDYVAENDHVLRGLSVAGVRWAFTTTHGDNWHPLTWLSHMLDVQLFGNEPAGHHAMSLLLHVINTLLVFAVLRAMTGASWRSATVAMLFALHPLHVESVAWVSERKDVLSTCFALLAIASYVRYTRDRAWMFYAATFLCMALSLLAKPMFVTLPCMLLLLDVWPLRRVRIHGDDDAWDHAGSPPAGWRRCLVEKWPLFALTAGSIAATYLAERRGIHLAITGADRLSNAVMSYVRYILHMLWPRDLTFLYPHPNLPGGTPWQTWQILAAAATLAVISVAVVLLSRHAPRRYLLVGWLWYLGTLVPVIGLMQVGRQAMADRYTYVPLLGLFIIIAWGGAEVLCRLVKSEKYRSAIAALVIAAMAISCSLLTWKQAQVWRSSRDLFNHALRIHPDSLDARYLIGHEWLRERQIDLAVRSFEYVLAIDPNHLDTLNVMGHIHQMRGEPIEAQAYYRRALQVHPHYIEARVNLGNTLYELGEIDAAISEYRKVLSTRPGIVAAHNNLGNALLAQGHFEPAIEQFQAALRVRPAHVTTRLNLANALRAAGHLEQAVEEYRRTLQLQNDLLEAHLRLGNTLMDLGRTDQAIARFREAVRLHPGVPAGHYNLGNALIYHGDTHAAASAFEAALNLNSEMQPARIALAWALHLTGDIDRAVKTYRQALQYNPDELVVLNNLAWLLATHPDEHVRDNVAALELAQRAVRLTQEQSAAALDTFAVALAASGRFDEAVSALEQALTLTNNDPAIDRVQLQRRLEQYRRGEKYVEPGGTGQLQTK